MAWCVGAVSKGSSRAEVCNGGACEAGNVPGKTPIPQMLCRLQVIRSPTKVKATASFWPVFCQFHGQSHYMGSPTQAESPLRPCCSASKLQQKILSIMQEQEQGKLRCIHTEVLGEQHSTEQLPEDAVIIQFIDASSEHLDMSQMHGAEDVAELHVKGQVLASET